MEKDLHPQYFKNATITCACGNVFHTGATKGKITVEICAKCHPFYTGEEKLVDTAGRVEKFRARRSKAASKVAKKQRIKKSEG